MTTESSTTFKAGDRVILTKPYDGRKPGAEGVVVSQSESKGVGRRVIYVQWCDDAKPTMAVMFDCELKLKEAE